MSTISLSPETPSDSPLSMEEALASPLYRDLGTPRVVAGGAAYPFELATAADPGRTVRLVDFAGRKPVALIFGSYT